jgi:hypothetical protein
MAVMVKKDARLPGLQIHPLYLQVGNILLLIGMIAAHINATKDIIWILATTVFHAVQAMPVQGLVAAIAILLALIAG